jgi:hypothetical protein
MTESQVHALCLMENHSHLVVAVESAGRFADMVLRNGDAYTMDVVRRFSPLPFAPR